MESVKTTQLRAPFSRSEARLAESGRAARDIVAQDAAIRTRNTERLRAARLAHEAANPPAIAVPAPVKRRKKATAA